MSGTEIIGCIVAVIDIIDASIKIYNGARKDMKLSKAFEVVGYRLPIILDTLKICQKDLETNKDSLSVEICVVLKNTLDSCDESARNLRAIFERVIPGEAETWDKRYSKVIRRLGKGSKVEELMQSITQNVEIIADNHLIRSVGPEQSFSAVHKEKIDFAFRKPFGCCLGQAPCINPDLFIGRDSELGQMKKSLRLDNGLQKQRRLILGGPGGIGKTQLALSFANRHKDDYTSIFWLNASSEATLKESFLSIAKLIFDIQDIGILQEQGITHVHRWLSDKNNEGWLLLFDNYDEPKGYEIKQYYPPASHGTIIVTTRLSERVAGRASRIQIQPFSKIKEGLEILKTRSKRGDVNTDPYARRLAERLDGFPLALASAGSYLQRSSLTFERYLQEYEKHWNIDPRRLPQLQEYQNRILYTTWNLSYSSLGNDDPDAARMLKILAYFDNQNIWHQLFNAGLNESYPGWLRELIVDDVSFEGAMGTLVDYCFLEVQTEQRSWSMHTCVHDWTLAVLNEELDAQLYWYALDCISASIRGVDPGLFGNIAYSRFAAHGARLAQQCFQQSDTICDIIPDRLGDAFCVARLLKNQVRLTAAEQVYQRVLRGYEKALGPDHISTLNTVNNLGNLYIDQGKLIEAEKMYQRALQGYEKALGLDHTSTLNSIHSLGNLYTKQGKLVEAEKMYQRVLQGYEKALGLDHTSIFLTVHNLGNLYAKQGNLVEAEKMYQRALQGYEKALGLDLVKTYIPALHTLENLGRLFTMQGRKAEAKLMYSRAMQGVESVFGQSSKRYQKVATALSLLDN